MSPEIHARCCKPFKIREQGALAQVLSRPSGCGSSLVMLVVQADYLTDLWCGCNSGPSAVTCSCSQEMTALGLIWWIPVSCGHVVVHEVPLPGLSQGRGRGVSDSRLKVVHGACSRLVLADTTGRVHKDVP